MKKVVTEFDAGKQSLRMYFYGRSAEDIVPAVLIALVGVGAAWLGVWLIRGMEEEVRQTGEAFGIVCMLGVCSAVTVVALFVVMCLLFGRDLSTLDKTGFRCESWLGQWRYWRRFEPLEDVMFFYVRHANAGKENVTAAYDLQAVLSERYSETFGETFSRSMSLLSRGDNPVFHYRQLLRVAAMTNALLDAMKHGQRVTDEADLRRRAKSLVRGYFPGDGRQVKAVERVDVVEIGSPRLTPVTQPSKTPWRLESGHDGSVFRRPDAFSVKKVCRTSMVGCVTAAVMTGFLWLVVYLLVVKKFLAPAWVFKYIIIGSVVVAVGLVARACREILKPVRWIIIRVNRHELRHESRTLGIRRTRGAYPLGGLARIAMEQRAECSALVFENAAGEPLAEIPDLTQDEARWMRDEILRNF